MKKTALLVAALGTAALALTACGSSESAPASSAAIPEVEATATALPGEPSATPLPTETTPPGATADPMTLTTAEKLTVAPGEDFTLKFKGDLPKGNGITVITDNGEVAVLSANGVDIPKKTAVFTAKKEGTIKISLGPVTPDGKFGEVGPDWSVYEVTVK